MQLYMYIAWLKEGAHTNKNLFPGKKTHLNFNILNQVYELCIWMFYEQMNFVKNKRFPPICSIYISTQSSVVCLR